MPSYRSETKPEDQNARPVRDPIQEPHRTAEGMFLRDEPLDLLAVMGITLDELLANVRSQAVRVLFTHTLQDEGLVSVTVERLRDLRRALDALPPQVAPRELVYWGQLHVLYLFDLIVECRLRLAQAMSEDDPNQALEAVVREFWVCQLAPGEPICRFEEGLPLLGGLVAAFYQLAQEDPADTEAATAVRHIYAMLDGVGNELMHLLNAISMHWYYDAYQTVRPSCLASPAGA